MTGTTIKVIQLKNIVPPLPNVALLLTIAWRSICWEMASWLWASKVALFHFTHIFYIFLQNKHDFVTDNREIVPFRLKKCCLVLLFVYWNAISLRTIIRIKKFKIMATNKLLWSSKLIGVFFIMFGFALFSANAQFFTYFLFHGRYSLSSTTESGFNTD